MTNHFSTSASTYSSLWAFASIMLFLLAAPSGAQAQAPLNQRVLVVYNSADADSISVANYYASKRGIPAGHLCAVNPGSTTWLNWSAFVPNVRTPVRNCLNAIGPANILYIVFSYKTPYKLVAPDGAGYSIDQFIADIYDQYIIPGQYGMPSAPQPYYEDSQSQGNVYGPFLSFADYRAQSGVPIFSVWRLDAATPALAKGLVDKAMLAESAGLSGQACIDRRYATILADYGSIGSFDWELRRMELFVNQAGLPLTVDTNYVEYGTAPAAPRCDNVALYSGGYSYNFYNNAFTWNPGAIGVHLESASAADPRGGPNWAANALINGITVTSGVLAEPTYLGMPRMDGIIRNLFEGANVGDAFMRNTYFLKWVILNMGDPLYRPFPVPFSGVTAPRNSLALNPRLLVGGKLSTGTITLAAPAPAGGITASLSSNQTSVATVQPSIFIPAGQTAASFPISTSVVTADATPLISATFGTTTLTNTLVPVPMLAAAAVSPVSVIGGTAVTGSVYLSSFPPEGGIVVNLSSNNAAATVPASVTVPESTRSAMFAIATSGVSATTAVTISASYAGATKTANITLSPLIFTLALSPVSVNGGVSTTLNRITLNGPAPGAVVIGLSSNTPGVVTPASVTIPASATASPYFTITTSSVAVTTVAAISASYGNVTKSLNLTVNPTVPVSVTLSPTAVTGGVSATLNRVTLNTPAPPGGAVVQLTSGDPAATVPASVTVPAGATASPYFIITTSSVAAQKLVTISAIYNGVTKTATLTVNPVALVSVTLSPAALVGGVSGTLNKVNLNGAAPAGGVAVDLTSSDPDVGVPPSVTVAAGATASPAFTITTTAVAAQKLVTITASFNGVVKTATLTVNPVALLSVTLSPTILVGGASGTLNKVNLNAPAPVGGLTVGLASSNPSVGVPISVTVAAGATASPAFITTTSAVAAQTIVTITASSNGVQKTANLTVNPVVLLSVGLSPAALVGGVSGTLNKVNLNGPAPAGGVAVGLASSNPGVGVPPSVTVPAGATASPAFTITTSAVAAQTIVTITASFNGVQKTANLTVNPVALSVLSLSPSVLVGGVSATFDRITLTGPAPPGGAVVNLSSGDPGVGVPATVTVAAGAAQSPYFTITTSAVAAQKIVTITASYSGLQKTANLTVNPVALSSITLSPASVKGGVSATFNRVALNGPAPPGGLVVTLSSGDPGVGVPATVTVAAGASQSAYFTITTSAVAAQNIVTITASYSGIQKTANLTVTP